MLKENVSLKSLHTFHLAVSSKYLLEIDTEEILIEFLMDNVHSSLPLLVLGGGSNMLFTQDYEGIILRNVIKGMRIVEETEDDVTLEVGGGENWHELVMYCIEKGWGGLENLTLIPGSVGAAPIQNIGAYGVEQKSCFISLTGIHLSTGQKRTFSAKECQFGYRDSFFKRAGKGKYMICRVVYKLSKRSIVNTSYGSIRDELESRKITQPGIKEVSMVVADIRRSKLPDPEKIGNSGSFFKNPVISQQFFGELQAKYPEIPNYPAGGDNVKLAAAWLIQSCGWKGVRRGDAGVHNQQALVLVNHGNAKGKEIAQLAMDIQSSVKETFGILLEPEVNMF
ncbi:MAG: UDP-N-acetylmuramate dehydrogenase [Bacteroidota bacterium]